MNKTLSELRALVERATKGPFRIERESCDCADGYPCHPPYPTVIVSETATVVQCPNSEEFRREVPAELVNLIEANAYSEENAQFVLAAVNTLPALLDRSDRLERAEKLLRRVQGHAGHGPHEACQGCRIGDEIRTFLSEGGKP